MATILLVDVGQGCQFLFILFLLEKIETKMSFSKNTLLIISGLNVVFLLLNRVKKTDYTC